MINDTPMEWCLWSIAQRYPGAWRLDTGARRIHFKFGGLELDVDLDPQGALRFAFSIGFDPTEVIGEMNGFQLDSSEDNGVGYEMCERGLKIVEPFVSETSFNNDIHVEHVGEGCVRIDAIASLQESPQQLEQDAHAMIAALHKAFASVDGLTK